MMVLLIRRMKKIAHESNLAVAGRAFMFFETEERTALEEDCLPTLLDNFSQEVRDKIVAQCDLDAIKFDDVLQCLRGGSRGCACTGAGWSLV